MKVTGGSLLALVGGFALGLCHGHIDSVVWLLIAVYVVGVIVIANQEPEC